MWYNRKEYIEAYFFILVNKYRREFPPMDIESQEVRYLLVGCAFLLFIAILWVINYAHHLTKQTPRAKKGKNNLAVRAKSQQYHKEM